MIALFTLISYYH